MAVILYWRPSDWVECANYGLCICWHCVLGKGISLSTSLKLKISTSNSLLYAILTGLAFQPMSRVCPFGKKGAG